MDQLAPRAAPSEHVLEPAEETSEALRAVGSGLSASYPLLPTHSLLRTAPYALLPSALLGATSYAQTTSADLRVEEHALALLGVSCGARVREECAQEGHHEEEEGQARDREEHAAHVQRDLSLPGPG